MNWVFLCIGIWIGIALGVMFCYLCKLRSKKIPYDKSFRGGV